MVLADTAECRKIAKHLLKAAFILHELAEILLASEFPCHVAGGPEPYVAVGECVIDGVGQHCEHSRYVECPVHQMTGVRREDQRSIVYFLRQVEAICCEIGSNAGNNRRTVEVKTTVVRPKFLSYDLRETGQMLGRGPFVNHALVP